MRRFAGALLLLAAAASPAGAYVRPTPSEVLNNEAAARLDPLAVPHFCRAGFSAPGDGGYACYATTPRPCALNGGAGDGGSQIGLRGAGASYSGCAILDRSFELNQRMFGIDCTGAIDSTRQVQAMWSAAVHLQVPIDHQACIAQTTAPITVSGHFISKGYRPALTAANTAINDPQGIGPGAWYFLNHKEKGFVFQAAGTGEDRFAYANDAKGFGTYRAQSGFATTSRQRGTITAGSAIVTGLASTSDLARYDTVSGLGIPATSGPDNYGPQYVAAILSPTSIALAAAATASGAVAITTTRFTPCVCDYDFYVSFASVNFDVSILNASKGVYLDNAGKTTGDVWGQPLVIGIDAESGYDNDYLGILHFWPYWSNRPEVLNFIALNGIGLQTARADGLHVRDLFCFGYNKCLSVATYGGRGGNQPGGTSYLVSFDRIYADSTEFGAYFNPDVSGATVQVKDFLSQPSARFAASGMATAGVMMQGASNTFNVTGTSYFDYSGAGHVIAVGNDDLVHLGQTLIGGWDYSEGRTDPAFRADGGARVVVDDFSFTMDAARVGTGCVRSGGTKSSCVRANLFSGYAYKGTPSVGAPAAAWNVDTSAAPPTMLAARGTLALPTGSGEITLVDGSSGNVCQFLAGGGGVLLLGQTVSGCSVTAGTPNALTLTYVNGAYTITNTRAMPVAIYVGDWRVRPNN